MKPTKDVISEVQEQLELATSKYSSLMERLSMFKKISEQSVVSSDKRNELETDNDYLEDNTSMSETREEDSYDLAPGDDQDDLVAAHEVLECLPDNGGFGSAESYCLTNNDLPPTSHDVLLDNADIEYTFAMDTFNENSPCDNPKAIDQLYATDDNHNQWDTRSLNECINNPYLMSDTCSLKSIFNKKRTNSIKTNNSSRQKRFQRIYRGVPRINKNNLAAAARWNENIRNKTKQLEPELKRNAVLGNRESPKDKRKNEKQKLDKIKKRSLSPSEIKQRFPNLERLSRPKGWKDPNETANDAKPKEDTEATFARANGSFGELDALNGPFQYPTPIFYDIKLNEIASNPFPPVQPVQVKKKEDATNVNHIRQLFNDQKNDLEQPNITDSQIVNNLATNRLALEWKNLNFKDSNDSLDSSNLPSNSTLPSNNRRKQATVSITKARKELLQVKQRNQKKSVSLKKTEPVHIHKNVKQSRLKKPPISMCNSISGEKKTTLNDSLVMKPLVETQLPTKNTHIDFAHRVAPKIVQACKGLTETLQLRGKNENKQRVFSEDHFNENSDRGDGAKNVIRAQAPKNILKIKPWNAGRGLQERTTLNTKLHKPKKDSFAHISSRVFAFMIKGESENQEPDINQIEEKNQPPVYNKEKKVALNNQANVSNHLRPTRENIKNIARLQKYALRGTLSEKYITKKTDKNKAIEEPVKPPGTAPEVRPKKPDTSKAKPHLQTKARSHTADGVRTHHLHGAGDTEAKVHNFNLQNKSEPQDDVKSQHSAGHGSLFPSKDNGVRRSIFNSIPFIVPKSLTKSHNLGLSIQQTLAALRMNQLRKDSGDHLPQLERMEKISTTSRSCYKCPAMNCPNLQVNNEDAWAVPKKDPWDDIEPPKRSICTCYSRNSHDLNTVVKNFLSQMIGNKLEEEVTGKSQQIVPLHCLVDGLFVPDCD